MGTEINGGSLLLQPAKIHKHFKENRHWDNGVMSYMHVKVMTRRNGGQWGAMENTREWWRRGGQW